jgi:hypothetical protein
VSHLTHLPSGAGVGSATLNTSQQVGGSVGTALLNTLAAGAATAYLAGRAITPANLQSAALHSYTTAFLYSALIFVVAAVIAGLVLPGATCGPCQGPPRRAPGPTRLREGGSSSSLRGWASLAAGDIWPGTDREPAIGIKHTGGAPRVADHLAVRLDHCGRGRSAAPPTRPGRTAGRWRSGSR